MDVALLALIVLWLALITYTVLGGADFGAGVLGIFTGRNAERQHEFINHALGPVWEANHVWLIFLVVGLFTLFPKGFAILCVALFFPLLLALLGIVLRGAAFIFRYYAPDTSSLFANVWWKVFNIASVLTPFFLGASAAAVASGHLLDPSGKPNAANVSPWLSPFAIIIGLMGIALCTALAAVYLTVEAKDAQDAFLCESYRKKALIAGAVTAVLGLLGLLLSPIYAPGLWRGMLGHGIPLVIVSMLLGLLTAALLWLKQYRLSRLAVIVATAFLLSAWGFSQYPYLVPPALTVSAAANEPNVIKVVLISVLIGLIILLPSLYYLYSIFKLPYPAPGRVTQPEGHRKSDGA
uniref:Cytochrome D ubiquinol oxidase subunit II n=1 Tax=Thermosporothrix sp. COM3 TaxID=2490863 RepID=A0A455SMI7_9CHLR|nr:cytochrome D ubiquinol oxidase subunit II [Thermosporothrix sp. COM3]